MIKRLRHRRLRARLALLAVFSLVFSLAFSQFVIAGHFQMVVDFSSSTPDQAVRCHADSDSLDATLEQSLCDLHCGTPDVQYQATPVFDVPMLPPVRWGEAWWRDEALSIDLAAHAEDRRRLRAWHRPTSHPASVLLI